MQEVSLYQEIFSDLEEPVEDLTGEVEEQKLNSRSLKFTTKVPKLERMCYMMEKMVLNKEAETVIYAGFQKVSRARDIWDRYLQIADNVDQIYIFGIDDDDLEAHPNIEFIYLPPDHKLVREWFLIMDQPLAKSMMVAHDLDGFGVYEDEKDRNFKGAKSHNPKVVAQAKELVEEVIDSA